VDAWDWQWYVSLSAARQLTDFPARNLIANIGFGNLATHTRKRPRRWASHPTGVLEFPLLMPPPVKVGQKYERVFLGMRS
jgi:hypothetical protein